MDPRTSRTLEGLDRAGSPGLPAGGSSAHPAWLEQAIAGLGAPGEYLAFLGDDEPTVVSLAVASIRIGRSLTADVRFDDPTVSRRHALIVRQDERLRILDDRSLNGVWVNGERVEAHVLEHGDEIHIGRHALRFLQLAESPAAAAPS